MLKNKLKSNEGSSMVLVIIAMVLVTLLIGTIGMQLNNQIKFNSKTEKYIQSKYESQGGIENGIAEFINKINVAGNLNSNTSSIENKYMDIVLHYVNEALYINGNNGIAESEIKEIVKEINPLGQTNPSFDLSKEKCAAIDNKINIAIDRVKDKNNEEKKLIYNELVHAKEYLKILQLNVTTENSLSNIEYIISRIINNCELSQKDIIYKELVLGSTINNHLQGLIDKMNIIDKGIYSKDKYTEYIQYTYEYDEIIPSIVKIIKSKKNGILLDKIDKNYGNGNGNRDFFDIVSNRINTVELELKLLREYILFLRDGVVSGGNSNESGNSNGSNSNNKLVVKIPKTVDNVVEEELDYISKVTVDECKLNSNISITELSNEYKIEVINNAAIINISLSIESKNDNYTTNSKVNIIISNIKDSQTYDVKYKVVSWN